ncbi:MAG TPA: hypothetical protein VGI80_06870 [Pyrinomonadaceae bacterium]|jgi:hypothetical protein
MRPRRLARLLLLLIIPVLVLGQAPDESKERQARLAALLDKTIGEIRSLRLPENRAFAYAQAGAIMWPQDQTRALSLFQSAGTELASAMDTFAARQKPGRYYDPNGSVQFRQQVLTVIGEKNAALALDILYRTRPPAIAKAMTPPDPRDKRIGSYQNNGQYLAQNEAYLENNLYRMAAEQDPLKAVPLLKAALARPPSQSTFEQLTRLAERDPAAAKDAGGDVIKRLVSTTYMRDGQPDYQIISLTNQIVEHYMTMSAANPIDNSQAKLRFDADAVGDLASKMITTYLTNKDARPYISTDTLLRYAQKFSPGYIDQLKQFNVEQPPNSNAIDTEYTKLMQAETPPDQMLSGAGRLPTSYRSQVYTGASNKLLGQGNSSAARAVLEENFTDDAREQALANFDQQNAYRLMNESKFTDAEAVINDLPEANRVNMLVQLATRAYSADKDKNRSYAVSVLENARGLVGDHPADNQEMSQLMEVVGGFAQIEPSSAADILEGLMPKVNELAEAAVVLWGFQDPNAVRDGEFVITQGSGFGQFGINGYMFGQLANADLDRTIRLIDSFSRPEMRVAMRLQMLSNSPTGISALTMSGRGNMIIRY